MKELLTTSHYEVHVSDRASGCQGDHVEKMNSLALLSWSARIFYVPPVGTQLQTLCKQLPIQTRSEDTWKLEHVDAVKGTGLPNGLPKLQATILNATKDHSA